jgi:hypothetical protein
MSRRTWKWAIVAASLLLLLVGIHLAWDWHRYRPSVNTAAFYLTVSPSRETAISFFLSPIFTLIK